MTILLLFLFINVKWDNNIKTNLNSGGTVVVAVLKVIKSMFLRVQTAVHD